MIYILCTKTWLASTGCYTQLQFLEQGQPKPFIVQVGHAFDIQMSFSKTSLIQDDILI